MIQALIYFSDFSPTDLSPRDRYSAYNNPNTTGNTTTFDFIYATRTTYIVLTAANYFLSTPRRRLHPLRNIKVKSLLRLWEVHTIWHRDLKPGNFLFVNKENSALKAIDFGLLIFFKPDHPWIQNSKKASNVPLGDIVRTRLKQFSVMNRFKKRALRVINKLLAVIIVNYVKSSPRLWEVHTIWHQRY
ncbi:Calcium-dependent protein kinase 13 [Castilleja foliolosa]|uniref:Calcium-dependent protein kinase 13 n=1 Tax=Castilleja foliolosa TaxID=1961234 RepID=A0ABD3BEW2_9LAMI